MNEEKKTDLSKAALRQLRTSYKALTQGPLVMFVEVKSLKKITGVYMIYSADGALLYIGSTNNFHVRFGTDLRHESTHTLLNKLIKDGTHLDRLTANVHFLEHYRYRIHICQNKREAEALEHFAIWVLDPKYNK